MDELKEEIRRGEIRENVKAVTQMLTLSEAFERYIEARQIKDRYRG